jgi:hypothetical protein
LHIRHTVGVGIRRFEAPSAGSPGFEFEIAKSRPREGGIARRQKCTKWKLVEAGAETIRCRSKAVEGRRQEDRQTEDNRSKI